MNLSQLKSLFVEAGCITLYAKALSENDNSKNQVYFGPDFQALNLFPNTGIIADDESKSPIFKAKLQFGWLLANGKVAPAPGAQLILYPQYPEVRFSGFLKGCEAPPSDLMTGRLKGRVLFLGITSSNQIVGFVVSADSEAAKEVIASPLSLMSGVFRELTLPRIPSGVVARKKLLEELKRIHELGWIDSKQLDSKGRLAPCIAPQCGGFTLEAELGIPKNSTSEPDFLGWEVKQHKVKSFDRIETSDPITLLTPEPNGGFYKEFGPEKFVRKFGQPDKKNRADRLNFGGTHVVAERCVRTGLTMQLAGFDSNSGKIQNANGEIALISDAGEIAASWSFKKILEHWSKKHSKAVYVPSLRRESPSRQYSYGSKVRLAQNTDPLRLLNAFSIGAVFYDPGIKLEQASTSPKVKRRSQFRIASKRIGLLYEIVETVEVLAGGSA